MLYSYCVYVCMYVCMHAFRQQQGIRVRRDGVRREKGGRKVFHFFCYKVASNKERKFSADRIWNTFTIFLLSLQCTVSLLLMLLTCFIYVLLSTHDWNIFNIRVLGINIWISLISPSNGNTTQKKSLHNLAHFFGSTNTTQHYYYYHYYYHNVVKMNVENFTCASCVRP